MPLGGLKYIYRTFGQRRYYPVKKKSKKKRNRLLLLRWKILGPPINSTTNSIYNKHRLWILNRPQIELFVFLALNRNYQKSNLRHPHKKELEKKNCLCLQRIIYLLSRQRWQQEENNLITKMVAESSWAKLIQQRRSQNLFFFFSFCMATQAYTYG